MVGQIGFLCFGGFFLASGGFVGGLSWCAREIGAEENRPFGIGCCVGFGALGVACLIAGSFA